MRRLYSTIFVLLTFFLPLAADSTKTIHVHEALSIYYDVLRQLDMNYVDTLNHQELTETAINAMLRQVDPYTVYYPKSKDDDLKMMTTGKYGGIGAIIQLRDSVVIISNPYEGKPAQKAGLLAGDVILSIDDFQAKRCPVAKVSENLRGEPGTSIRITVLRNETDTIVKDVVRESIHMDPVDYSCLFDSIAYISLAEFTDGAANDFIHALYELSIEKGAKRLILDLRGNGGGIVDEAVQILGNFLEKGTEVVSMRGKTKNSSRTYRTYTQPMFLDMPLIVLVDRNSASASEIVAGALQDLGRAKLIGERTFGKGLVQNIRPIEYDGYLKVTTSRYYLPSGRCIQAIDYGERQRGGKLERDTAGGILPDIVLKDSAKVDICYSLYIKNMFYDYSVDYHHRYPTFASQDLDWDAVIEDFCQYLEKREFTYETETGKYYKDMLRIAKEEDLGDELIQQLQALEPQLNPPFREAVMRHQEDVKKMLGAEIMERYLYQKGRTAFMLKSDKVLLRALEEIRK